ncbi:hypothetical protein KIPB_014824, partial [Kipferlia bialata]
GSKAGTDVDVSKVPGYAALVTDTGSAWVLPLSPKTGTSPSHPPVVVESYTSSVTPTHKGGRSPSAQTGTSNTHRRLTK